MNIFKINCNSSFKFFQVECLSSRTGQGSPSGTSNIISLIVLTIIIYRFYSVISFDIGLLSLIISFLISLVLSNFVLNKFEYSKNIYIGSAGFKDF